MKITRETVTIEGTPDECREYMAKERDSRASETNNLPELSSSRGLSKASSEPNGRDIVPGHDRVIRRSIEADRFFKSISTSMARIMLAFIKHQGKLAMSELIFETGVNSGSSLRKPGGALNDRMRVASSGRIQEFYSVVSQLKRKRQSF